MTWTLLAFCGKNDKTTYTVFKTACIGLKTKYFSAEAEDLPMAQISIT